MKYTQEEIDSNINKLKHTREELLLKRKGLNTELREVKNSISYWEEFDKHQLKAF